MKPLLFTILAPLVSQTASAQPPDDPSVAITVSPLHMFVPMAELTTEIRLAPKLSVAAIAGVGAFHDQATNARVTLVEGGASLRYYLTGSFRSGVQLGAEAAYVHASTTDMTIDIRARGLGLSPFVGYKWTHHSGFTLEAQGGVTWVAADARSSTASASRSAVGPMLNLNVGWSL
jgi:hypothetical protein